MGGKSTAAKATKKKCTKCGKVRLLGMFSKHRIEKDGLTSRCKACLNKPGWKEKEVPPEGFKRCSGCGKMKLLERFYWVRKGKFGRGSRCKDCGKLYRQKNAKKTAEYKKLYRRKNAKKIAKKKKQHYQKNARKIKKRVRLWYQKNAKKATEYQKLYRRKNAEKVAKRQKLWHQKNAKKVRKRQKLYRQKNAEKILEEKKLYRQKNAKKIAKMKKSWGQKRPEMKRAGNRRYRTRRRGVNENFGNAEAGFVRSFWANRCGICGGNKKGRGRKVLPIDHWLPLTPADGSPGHPLTMSNAVLLCIKCNGTKQDHYPKEVYKPAKIKNIEKKLKAQVKAWEAQKEEVA